MSSDILQSEDATRELQKAEQLRFQNRIEDAVAMIESLYIRLDWRDTLAAVELHSACMLDLGRCYEGLAMLDPNIQRPFYRFNASIFLIGLGRWPAGWQLYKSRHDCVGTWMPRDRILSHLDGIRDHELIIYHEQGYGDTLQFIRYALPLAEKVKHLAICVPPAMYRLMEHLPLPKRSFTIYDKDGPIRGSAAAPMLDLPSLFQQRLDNIPAPVPYFQIPKLAIGRNRLPPTTKTRIGICWAGHRRENPLFAAVDRRRSVPFELIQPMLAMDQFQWVSLQQEKIDCPDLLQPLKPEGDWLDTAAVVSQLDMVISVDTAVAHLVGALNKSLWLLNRYDSCFRWGFHQWTSQYYPSWHEKTPWYPSARIFRQSKWNHWPDVIERVMASL